MSTPTLIQMSKEGFLRKRSNGRVKRWQRRYFELVCVQLQDQPAAAEDEAGNTGEGDAVASWRLQYLDKRAKAKTRANVGVRGAIELRRLNFAMARGTRITLQLQSGLGAALDDDEEELKKPGLVLVV